MIAQHVKGFCHNCPHEAVGGPLACQQCPHYSPGFDQWADFQAVPIYLLEPDPDADLDRIHTCPVCGITFIDRPNRVYCSRKCRKRKEGNHHQNYANECESSVQQIFHIRYFLS